MEVVPQNNLIDNDLSLSGLCDSISLPSTPDRKRVYYNEKPYLKPKPKNIPSSVLRSLTKQQTDPTRAVSMLPTIPIAADPARPPLFQETANSSGETEGSPSHANLYTAFRSRPLTGRRSFDLLSGTRDPTPLSPPRGFAVPPECPLTRSVSNQEVPATEQIPKPRPSTKSASPLLLMDRRSRVQDLVTKFDAISLNNTRPGVPVIPGKVSPKRCMSALTNREEHTTPLPPSALVAEHEEAKGKRNKFSIMRKFSPKSKDTKPESPSVTRKASLLDSPIVERSESLYESQSLDRNTLKKARERKRKESFMNFLTGPSPKTSTIDVTDPCACLPPASAEAVNGDTDNLESKKKKKKGKGRNIMKHVLRSHKNTGSSDDLSAQQGKHNKKKKKQVEAVVATADLENTVEVDMTKRGKKKDKGKKGSADSALSVTPVQTDSIYTDLDEIEANRKSWLDLNDSPLSQKRPGSKRDSAYDSEQSRGDSAFQEPCRISFKSSSLADEILEQVGISRNSLVVVNDMYESISLSDRPTPISLTDEDDNSFISYDESHKTSVELDYANCPAPSHDDLYDDIVVLDSNSKREAEASESADPCSNTLTPVTPLNRSGSPSLIYENFNDSVEDSLPIRSFSESSPMGDSPSLYDLPYEQSEKRHTLTAQPRPGLFKISPLETSLELDLYESVEVSREMLPRALNARPMTSAPSSVSHKSNPLSERDNAHTPATLPKRPSTIFTTDTASLYRSTDIASVEALILEASIACKKSLNETSTPIMPAKEPPPSAEKSVSQQSSLAQGLPPPRPSEGDSFSDSSDNEYGSVDLALADTSSCSSPVLVEDIVSTVRVLYDYETRFPEDLPLKVGDIINVLDASDPVWWIGRNTITLKRGYVPCSYVEPYSPELMDTSFDEDPLYMDVRPGESLSPQKEKSLLKRRSAIKRSKSNSSEFTTKTVVPKLTQTEMRCRVIQELVSTEGNYLQSLNIVIKCREECLKRVGIDRPDSLFTQKEIEQVFHNIEDLYQFESTFLQELNRCVKEEKYDSSVVGNLFVRHEQGFKDVYVPYCNNQTVSSCRLGMMMEDTRHLQFFRSFTVLTTEDRLPIETYLLKPVQKICKYHLQLNELLKSTPASHPDHPHVEQALEVMRNVTANINEKKRRIDNLPSIMDLQHSIDNWAGTDILECSTTLLQSGKLYKISKGHSQERKFYLFDNLLLYCKEDALRTLKLKGRITLSEENIVIDMEDDQLHHNNIPLKNAWKIINHVKNKEYIIYTKDAKTKHDWMNAFKRERELVEGDELDNFKLTTRELEDAVFLKDANKKQKKKNSTARTKSLGLEFIQKSRSLGKEKIRPEIVSTDVHQIAN